MNLNKMLAKVFGSSNEREVKRLRPLVERVNALEDQVKKLSDEELPTFHPICVVPEPGMVGVPPALPMPSGPAPAAVELVLAGDRRVEVRPGFDAETLARVIQIVEALPC